MGYDGEIQVSLGVNYIEVFRVYNFQTPVEILEDLLKVVGPLELGHNVNISITVRDNDDF